MIWNWMIGWKIHFQVNYKVQEYSPLFRHTFIHKIKSILFNYLKNTNNLIPFLFMYVCAQIIFTWGYNHTNTMDNIKNYRVNLRLILPTSIETHLK